MLNLGNENLGWYDSHRDKIAPKAIKIMFIKKRLKESSEKEWIKYGTQNDMGLKQANVKGKEQLFKETSIKEKIKELSS